MADLVASFQAAAVEQLVQRTADAARAHGVGDVVLAGGVACNGALRARMRAVLGDGGGREADPGAASRRDPERPGVKVHAPPPRWCTDNAAMIAGAADREAERRRGQGHDPHDRRLNAIATWPLSA
jgi:N6-L-threonylcarbamoyladenine synthase